MADEAASMVDSFLRLSVVLGMDRTKLYRYRYRDGAPAEREDGQWDVEEWRDYIAAVDAADGDATSDDHTEENKRLKNENLRLKNAMARFDLMRKQGNLMTLTEHLGEVREILEQSQWLTRTIPTRTALLTTDEGIRSSIRTLCEHIEREFRQRLTTAEVRAEEAEAAAAEIVAWMDEPGVDTDDA